MKNQGNTDKQMNDSEEIFIYSLAGFIVIGCMYSIYNLLNLLFS